MDAGLSKFCCLRSAVPMMAFFYALVSILTVELFSMDKRRVVVYQTPFFDTAILIIYLFISLLYMYRRIRNKIFIRVSICVTPDISSVLKPKCAQFCSARTKICQHYL